MEEDPSIGDTASDVPSDVPSDMSGDAPSDKLEDRLPARASFRIAGKRVSEDSWRALSALRRSFVNALAGSGPSIQPPAAAGVVSSCPSVVVRVEDLRGSTPKRCRTK